MNSSSESIAGGGVLASVMGVAGAMVAFEILCLDFFLLPMFSSIDSIAFRFLS